MEVSGVREVGLQVGVGTLLRGSLCKVRDLRSGGDGAIFDAAAVTVQTLFDRTLGCRSMACWVVGLGLLHKDKPGLAAMRIATSKLLHF
jgi:hypothetical protein